ncbi:YncE family protein [Bacillus mycoides]|uniref:YncE family protein n=1 Tax=Bacillus mycoides TaxID=1405 RepID=UPI003D030FE3
MSNLIPDLQKFLRRYISVNQVSGAIVEGLLTQINTSNATAVINSEYGVNEVAIDQIISYIILPYIYVANQATSDVSVIDPANNMIITTIPVDSGPFDVAITPNGLQAYVTCSFGNSVAVINTASNTVSATIPVGNNPRGIAISPNGQRVLVVNTNSNSVSVINTSNNSLVTTITVGMSPRYIAITPNSQSAYVSNFFSNSISVINISNNTLSATISPGNDHPLGIVLLHQMVLRLI